MGEDVFKEEKGEEKGGSNICFISFRIFNIEYIGIFLRDWGRKRWLFIEMKGKIFEKIEENLNSNV